MQEEVFNHYKEYTTNEEAWGYWIDGKVIYRKTINFGALPNAMTKDVAHNISDIDQIIKMEGIASSSSDARFIMLPLTYDSNNTNFNAELSATTTDVRVACVGNRSGYSAYITLYYTKVDAEENEE